MSEDEKEPTVRPLIPRPDSVHPENALSETPPPYSLAELNVDSLALTSLELEPSSVALTARVTRPGQPFGNVAAAEGAADLARLDLDSLTMSLDSLPNTEASDSRVTERDELDADELLVEPSQAELELADPAQSAPSGELGFELAPVTLGSVALAVASQNEIGVSGPTVEAVVASLLPREPFLWAESAEPPGATRRENSDYTQPLIHFAAVSQPPSGGEVPLDIDRTAASELTERGLLESWVSRAEWMEQEARGQRDPKQQGRTLLVASELWAMAGNPQQARVLAEQAAKLIGGAAQRQARQLAAQGRDFQAASRMLSAEAHSAGTPQARAHAAFYNAEIERIELADAPASLRHFEQGGRAHASDPRGNIARLCSQLSSGSRPPSVVWPEAPEFKALDLATRALAVLRGETRWPSAELTSVAPAVAFIDAQRALLRG
ncbi:MAG: hypothetical protein RJA70_2033, partial [Pseudomonadota bacterium]